MLPFPGLSERFWVAKDVTMSSLRVCYVVRKFGNGLDPCPRMVESKLWYLLKKLMIHCIVEISLVMQEFKLIKMVYKIPLCSSALIDKAVVTCTNVGNRFSSDAVPWKYGVQDVIIWNESSSLIWFSNILYYWYYCLLRKYYSLCS